MCEEKGPAQRDYKHLTRQGTDTEAKCSAFPAVRETCQNYRINKSLKLREARLFPKGKELSSRRAGVRIQVSWLISDTFCICHIALSHSGTMEKGPRSQEPQELKAGKED